MRATVVVVVACVALGGCYQPPTSACGIVCTDTCPGKMMCTPEHVCRDPDGTCASPPLDFATFGVGSRHVCGLDLLGSIWCWGDNSVYQLGVPDLLAADVPTLVGDPKMRWTELAVGSEHACGITGGQVLCWGQNTDGQVAAGTGSKFDHPTPPQFAGQPIMFDHVAAGGSHTCALSSGALYCWGKAPQNGVGTVSVPTRVGTLSDWTQISAGFDQTCGISASQGVMCWGNNNSHQTGDPTQATVAMPEAVALPMPATKIVAGDSITCALLADTTLWCWGYNGWRVIDDDNTRNPATPIQMGTAGGWTSISLTWDRACGVQNGMVQCWGTSNVGGLGDGLWGEFQLPFTSTRQVGPADVVAVAPSAPTNGRRDELGCMLAGTRLQCWGENSFGELGVGMHTRHLDPVEVRSSTGAPWAHIYTGDNHTCAITTAGELDCWGADYYGQVGAGIARGVEQPCIDGQPCDRPTPTRAPSMIGVYDELVTGHDFTCARAGAVVRCWGDDSYYQLGGGGITGHDVVAVDPPEGSWTKIFGSSGGTSACGLTSTNKLECWGNLNGNYLNVPTDTSDLELHDLGALAFGNDATCATRSSDASRVCWGGNGYGQLGDGSINANTTPTARDTGTIARVAMHSQHACALTTTGGVTCWGYNGNHESGAATGTMVMSPMTVAAIDGPVHGCTALAVGPDFSCAICNATVMCWGRTRNASTGHRTVSTRETADLVGLPAELHFTELVAGYAHACALDDTGRMFCWGDAAHGAIGDGGHASNIPMAVAGP